MPFVVPTPLLAPLFEPLAPLFEPLDPVDGPREPPNAAELAAIYAQLAENQQLLALQDHHDDFFFNEAQYPNLPDVEYFAGPEGHAHPMAGLIQDDGSLTNNVDIHLTNPLAKLLYAYVWKTGGRRKLRTLVRGIQNLNIDEANVDRYVFYQFGRHLVDRQQPIVDQHSIRAHRFMAHVKANHIVLQQLGPDDLANYRNYAKNSSVSRRAYINYLDWITTVLPLIADDHPGLRNERSNALSALDRIMYALGKILRKTD